MLIDCEQALYVVRFQGIPWGYTSENIAISTLAQSNYLDNMRARKLGYGYELKSTLCILFDKKITKSNGSYIMNYILVTQDVIMKYCEMVGIPKEVFEEYAD